MAHYTDKTHIFRDEDDNRTVVITTQLGEGYKAFVIEGLHNDLDVRGYGDTRMAAIADLNEAIQKELNADDAEDYRSGEDAR